jgi:hypothetical protein
MNWIILGVILTLVTIVLYQIYMIYRYFKNIKRRRFSLSVSVDSSKLPHQNHGREIETLLTKIFYLGYSFPTSFQIHKVQDRFEFCIGSQSHEVLRTIKLEIEKIPGIKVIKQMENDTQNDFFNYLGDGDSFSTYRAFGQQLVSYNKYGNFNNSDFGLVANITHYLESLDFDEFGSVVFSFIPTVKNVKLNSKITSKNQKQQYDSKEKGYNYEMSDEIKELKTKTSSPIYAVKISILGSSWNVVNNLRASFLICNDKNQFNHKDKKLTVQDALFVSDDCLVPENKIYLNIKELTSMIQFSGFGQQAQVKNIKKAKSKKALQHEVLVLQNEAEFDTSEINPAKTNKSKSNKPKAKLSKAEIDLDQDEELETMTQF